MKTLIQNENVHEFIYLIRGQKVMLGSNLAELYGVPTKVLNQAVRRNKRRFPADFMFQLTWEEAKSLRSQNVTLNRGGNIKYRPYAFTEQGVAMLSGVLNSNRAIDVNIMVMRAFVRLRQLVSLNRSLAKRLAAIERRLTGYDVDIQKVYEIIQHWPPPSEEPAMKGRLGF